MPDEREQRVRQAAQGLLDLEALRGRIPHENIRITLEGMANGTIPIVAQGDRTREMFEAQIEAFEFLRDTPGFFPDGQEFKPAAEVKLGEAPKPKPRNILMRFREEEDV